jgi:hypothetical protein
VELTAALCVILVLVMVCVAYHPTRCEIRATREDLTSTFMREMERMGRRVDTATQANTGARLMAQNAIARAERAEVAASQPVVLVVSPANDADLKNDKIKMQ